MINNENVKSDRSFFGFVANDQMTDTVNYASIHFSSIPRQIIRTNFSNNCQVKDHQGKRLLKHSTLKSKLPLPLAGHKGRK